MRLSTEQQKANTANTKEWLEASKGIIIAGYIEPATLTLADEPHFFARTDFEQVSQKTSQPGEKH